MLCRSEDSTLTNPTYLPAAFASSPNLPIHYGSLGPEDTATPRSSKLHPAQPNKGEKEGEDYQEVEAREGVYHVLGEVEEEGEVKEVMYEIPNTSDLRCEK